MKLKAETFIGLSILVAVGLIIGIFFSPGSGDKSPEDYHAEELTSVEQNNTVSDFTRFVSMRKNICEGCHLSGKKFIPQAYEIEQHVKGGAYCLKCHTISHERHPVNQNVTCEKCHGKITPQIPSPLDGKIVCNNCHAFPNPLLPSYGNLIKIHRPRGINCIACHTGCTRCHEKILINEKWNRRLKHINSFI